MQHYSTNYLLWTYLTTSIIGWSTSSVDVHKLLNITRLPLTELQKISASFVQGSTIGPASYVANSSDLKAVHSDNFLCKYADDMYIIIPSKNVSTRQKNRHVERWAKLNNLSLNRTKCAELVIQDVRRKRHTVSPFYYLMSWESKHWRSSEWQSATIRAVRRRRRWHFATPPPPIVTDRRAAAAAADRMSASRRRRFRDVFTSCCTPAT